MDAKLNWDTKCSICVSLPKRFARGTFFDKINMYMNRYGMD